MEKNSPRRTVLIIALVLVLIGICVVSVLLVMSLNEDNGSPVVQQPLTYVAPNTESVDTTDAPNTESVDTTAAGTYSEPVAETKNEELTIPIDTEAGSTAAPTTVPTATETGSTFFEFSGKPAMGYTSGSWYLNTSVRLSCQLYGGEEFEPEDELLEFNEVSSTTELLSRDNAVLAMSSGGSILIAAYRLGSDVVGGYNTTEDALEYVAVEDAEYLEEAYNATITTFDNVYVTFTAGDVEGWLISASYDNEQITFLYLGYRVGDHMVFMSICDEDQDGIEDILYGLDVK